MLLSGLRDSLLLNGLISRALYSCIIACRKKTWHCSMAERVAGIAQKILHWGPLLGIEFHNWEKAQKRSGFADHNTQHTMHEPK